MRATVAWSMVSGPGSRRNCLGMSVVLSGQRRVPLPPARIEAYILGAAPHLATSLCSAYTSLLRIHVFAPHTRAAAGIVAGVAARGKAGRELNRRGRREEREGREKDENQHGGTEERRNGR